MRRLPPNIPPRGLTPEQAAEYVGYTAKLFAEMVKQGMLPAALPGGNFDKAAIDAALDQLSGLAKPSAIDWRKAARENPPYEGRREVRHQPAK